MEAGRRRPASFLGLRRSHNPLDFCRAIPLKPLLFRSFHDVSRGAARARARMVMMFEGLFDFGKQRTLKQSVGFYIFYAGIFLAFTGFMSLLGF